MFRLQITIAILVNIAFISSVSGVHNDLCADLEYDTIFSTGRDDGASNDTVYIFYEDDYWELQPTASQESYVLIETVPKKIYDFWPGLPGNINAAFTNYTENVTYFFKGSQYWQYSGQTMMSGFPKLIAEGFPGIPNDIDIAFRCTGKVYFFKGGEFYTYKPYKYPPVGKNNPRSVSGSWKGVPDDVKTAVQLSKDIYTYFFKESVYYKLLIASAKVEAPNTRSLNEDWLGCDDAATAED